MFTSGQLVSVKNSAPIIIRPMTDQAYTLEVSHRDIALVVRCVSLVDRTIIDYVGSGEGDFWVECVHGRHVGIMWARTLVCVP